MGKVSEFIKKHGYSYKSFFVALIVFPPASLFIAWKIQDISKATRIILTIIAIIVPLIPLYIGAVGISNLFSFLAG